MRAITSHQLKYKIEKIADISYYTEGPAVDSKGNIYFTTLTGGIIFRLGTEGTLTEWGHSLCPNGQVILNNDEHLVCDSHLGAIRRFDAKGKFVHDEVRGHCCGKKISSPNDLVLDVEGGIYFTDSVRREGAVFYLGKDGQQNLVADEMDYPNGLVLSRDQQSLYIAESYKNRIVQVNLISPGMSQGGKRIFADLPEHSYAKQIYNLPDGLAIDENGNILIAHYGMQAIQVLSSIGTLLATIDTALPLTSNLFFLNAKTLIVTGGYNEPGPGSLLKIHFNS